MLTYLFRPLSYEPLQILIFEDNLSWYVKTVILERLGVFLRFGLGTQGVLSDLYRVAFAC